MLNIKPPNYKFCPFCGDPLTVRIEEEKKFKHCKRDNWTYYPQASQAAIAIIIENKKLLLVKRNRNPYKGRWMLPAGFLDYGELPTETIVREVKEETGLDVKSSVFFDTLQPIDDPRAPVSLTFYYKVAVKNGKNIKNGDAEENSDIQWFDLNNIPPIAWKDHKRIIKRLQNDKSTKGE